MVDMKYVVGILLIVIASGLFYTARIDQTTFLAILATALAIMGYTYIGTRKKKLDT